MSSKSPVISSAADQPAGLASASPATTRCAVPRSAAPRSAARRALAGALAPLVRRAAKAYVAGDSLEAALRVQAALAESSRGAILGYWSDANSDPTDVSRQYTATLAALAGNRLAGICSVKLPALAFRPDLLERLGAEARELGVALHCDSHRPEEADRTRESIEHWKRAGVAVGTTLPGRWRRSPSDADWAVEHGVPVRVVKGQWADVDVPEIDMRAGFLEVIDRLAGRARAVAVATHDTPLALAALERLRTRGTPAVWELLHGLPMQAALRAADSLRVDARIYVPFGSSYLPYGLGQLIARPRLALWLLKDLLAGG